ncbi:MAG TPA: Type 1 glutamine amidotransferase-like domain-containing protein [Candidatus Paceibacterota bacterium]|nr:Type 1 glutamine amidotransferase-like domain-containing protein [Candidatus Paceibacterota bacterium]HMP18878.1 Type 1 glutamine amidotransferase-like domain-containing protein [Candidatus Paceibacterota bacterium]HMP85039.1 Type 1 glutamine amidotransferase-like domain-containing protein [Candidatus Paceibacterota bacterium]
MKLFLSSLSISSEQKEAFINLVEKDLSDIKFALIENAADPYSQKAKGFVEETRKNLQSFEIKLEQVNLLEYKNRPNELFEKLSKFDVVWIGGGNTFYIRWLMKETGFDNIINKLLEKGIVYGGGSAGAIVAGKTLKYFDLVDNPEDSPEQIYNGLGLTNLIIIPHWNTESFRDKLKEIKQLYEKEDIEVTTIEDGKAIVIKDEDIIIV